MTIQRFLKKCDEFFICSETGNSGDVFYESVEERKTLFQIIVKGSGKIAKLFDSDYEEFDDGENNFANCIPKSCISNFDLIVVSNNNFIN